MADVIVIPEPLAIEAMLRYGATHIGMLAGGGRVPYIMRRDTVPYGYRAEGWLLVAYVEDVHTLVPCGPGQFFDSMVNVRDLTDFIRSETCL